MSDKLDNIGKSSTGMDENVAALLAIFFAPISSIVFFFIEKESKFVKFHALQSGILGVALFVIYTVLGFIPVIGWIILFLLPIPVLVLYVFMLVKAYKGEWFILPIIGKISMEQSNI